MEEERKKLPAAVSLGRRGGLTKSPAKAAAARLNGLLGGAQAWKKPREEWKARAPRKKVIKKKKKFKLTVPPAPTLPTLTAIPHIRPRATQKLVKEHSPR